MSIRDLLSQCEEDTRRAINAGAANRLANWRQYQTENELVQFIQRTIRDQNNRANGWELGRQGFVSLESIVIAHPEFFTAEDLNISRATLGQ
jgi:hypothetical protein